VPNKQSSTSFTHNPWLAIAPESDSSVMVAVARRRRGALCQAWVRLVQPSQAVPGVAPCPSHPEVSLSVEVYQHHPGQFIHHRVQADAFTLASRRRFS